jgi:hypothetical protein
MPNSVRQSPTLVQDRADRTSTYQAIGRLIWMRYCLENHILYEGFEHCPDMQRRAILEAIEALVNMALDSDRRDAALMCGADALVGDAYAGTYTLEQMSPQQKQSWLNTFEGALNTFLVNMLNVPPDPHYRDRMCREIDAIAPKVTP